MLYEFCLSLKRSQKHAILLVADLFWAAFALVFAQALIIGRGPDAEMLGDIWPYLVAILPVCLVLTLFFGLHRVKLNAYQLRGIVETGVVAVAIAFAGGFTTLLPVWRLQMSGFVVLAMSYVILSVSWRLLLRSFLMWVYRRAQNRKRVVIYGAGQTGQQLAAALATDNKVEPVCFVDDNPTLQSLTVAGLQVYGPARLARLVESRQIDRVVLAMPSVGRATQARIARRLRGIGCEVHTLPSFADLVEKGGIANTATPVELSHLMGRARLEEELPGVSDAYAGRRILVTGAGGSIGSELCRQLLLCDPEKLVLMDHAELSLYTIDRDLRDIEGKATIVSVLGSICEPTLVREVLRTHGIEIVLHAAAYKHVPLVETNPFEGMRNNVLGTKVLADEARAAGVERFTLISSDKAVRPVGAMGCSKRLAEQIVQDLATRSDTTRFSMVRFGNVLGSSGSVIPLFQDQIMRGGPVTLTHGGVTRYFMTIPEAVGLLLLAGSFARGGDVFVLDMGAPVSIRSVARQMIENAGYSVREEGNPDGEIELQITGLRPGEKLYEELLIGSDMLTTPHPKILRAHEGHLSEIEMAHVMQTLRNTIETRDPEALQNLLERWVESSVAETLDIVNE